MKQKRFFKRNQKLKIDMRHVTKQKQESRNIFGRKYSELIQIISKNVSDNDTS